MTYCIRYHENVIKKDIPKLAHPVRKLIQAAIDKKLTTHPFAFSSQLRYHNQEVWLLRVGDYRVAFHIVEDHNVEIVRIGHRKDFYN